jgi:hypothetical protein
MRSPKSPLAHSWLLFCALCVLALTLAACGSSSSPQVAKTTLDIRGTWDEVALVGPAQYPQTLHITTEDLFHGTWSGNDVSPNGQTFGVSGTIAGSNITFTTTASGYTSKSQGHVVTSGATWTMSGTFSDSGHLSGTYTATRAIMLP